MPKIVGCKEGCTLSKWEHQIFFKIYLIKLNLTKITSWYIFCLFYKLHLSIECELSRKQ